MFYLADVGIFVVLMGLSLIGFCNANYKGFRLAEASHLERVVILFSEGWGLIAASIWALGSFNPHSSNWVLGVSIVFLFAALLTLFNPALRTLNFAQFRALKDGFKRLPLPDKLLFGYVVGMCALTFVLTLAPPSGADYDGLTYHLAGPQRYLQAGGVVELPYDHHTYFPFMTEMWFALGLALKGPVLAKLFHWMMLPLSCAAIWAFGRRHLGVRAASWAAALWVSLPAVQSEATTAYIDLAFSLWVILAWGCAANWRETDNAEWLGWAGAFGGFALGSKYLGALTFGFIGVWALARMILRHRIQIVPLLRYAVFALVLGGGWYLRNALWTGNPVYPFAYGIFGGKGWTAQMAADYTKDQLNYGFGRGPLDLLLAPWRLSMAPLNAIVDTQRGPALSPQPWWPMSNATLTNGNSGLFESAGLALQIFIGPALLAFTLPVLFIRRKPAALGLWLWAVAAFSLFWFPTGQYLRYLLPAFALLCLPCGWMIARIEGRLPPLRWITYGALIAWFAFVPALTIHNGGRAWEVVLGRTTPEAYLRRTFAPYRAMEWLNSPVGVVSRAGVGMVAVYGEPRCFYLRVPYFWADDAHNNLVDYTKVGNSGAALVAELRRLHTTYILWNTTGPFGPPQAALQDAVKRGLLQSSFEANGCIVFSLAREKKP